MQIQNTTTRLTDEIKRKLGNKDIRQKDYAKQYNLNESTLSNYINGKREMPYDILSLIAKDLDLDLNYIFKSSEMQKYSFDDEEVEFILSLRSIEVRDRKELFNSIKALVNCCK